MLEVISGDVDGQQHFDRIDQLLDGASILVLQFLLHVIPAVFYCIRFKSGLLPGQLTTSKACPP
jgi:hypothetical protein